MTERTTLTQQRGKETRQRILDAAYLVFARQGLGHASVDDVAREAEISKGALYHHFASKEDLFHALLRDRVRRCATTMLLAATPIAPLSKAIRKVIEASFESQQSNESWMPMYMEFWGQAVREDYARSVMADSHQDCRRTLSQILRNGQESGLVRPDLDTETAAVLYIALVDGIALQRQVDPAIDLERAKALMADMIVTFASAPGPVVRRPGKEVAK